jgi:hypothetical protein
MASLVKKLCVLFLVCHDLRQSGTTQCDSFQRDPWKCRPSSSESRHQGGNRVSKRAEKGLVVWEESAEVSGPRRRAWRKLPRLAMTRPWSVDPSHTRLGFPDGRTSNFLVMCTHRSFARNDHKRFIQSGERRRSLNWSRVGLLKTLGKLCSHGRSFTP